MPPDSCNVKGQRQITHSVERESVGQKAAQQNSNRSFLSRTHIHPTTRRLIEEILKMEEEHAATCQHANQGRELAAIRDAWLACRKPGVKGINP